MVLVIVFWFKPYYNFPIVILDGLVQYYSVLNIKMMVKATICLL